MTYRTKGETSQATMREDNYTSAHMLLCNREMVSMLWNIHRFDNDCFDMFVGRRYILLHDISMAMLADFPQSQRSDMGKLPFVTRRTYALSHLCYMELFQTRLCQPT